ncbi:MAG TPA: hypothetical protein PLE10_01605 [Brevefilum sp.]|nr:hypothetical protein [Brevefilum sp.]HPL69094.1 hypothetical protein [Brevefilum sp.]
MTDKSIPESMGPMYLEPLSSPNLEDICRRLDHFYLSSDIKKKVMPSQLLRGALTLMRKDVQKINPDWMSQAAHSIREIFYDFNRGKGRALGFDYYGSAYDSRKAEEETGKYFGLFTDIAHHDFESASKNPLIRDKKNQEGEITPELFERLIYQFLELLTLVLKQQLDIHKEIDRLTQIGPISKQIPKIESTINFNLDAKRYFFSLIDETWMDFLWENAFLNSLKEELKDQAQLSSLSIELNYLLRIVGQVPDKIAKIILNDSVATTNENLNPEVIYCFIRLTEKLPHKLQQNIIRKIAKQEWVRLISNSGFLGFEFQAIFDSLVTEDDYESVLILARELLSVNPDSFDINDQNYQYRFNPFYVDYLEYTKVFQYLLEIDSKYLEQAFDLVLGIITNIVSLGKSSPENSVFSHKEPFMLLGIDFFTVQPLLGQHFTQRENIRELAATLKVLGERLIEKYAGGLTQTKEIYHNQLSKLPDSLTMWRLRLYLLSVNPEYFREFLQQSLSRIFDLEMSEKFITELIFGAEYKKALKVSFPLMDQKFQRQYIKQTLDIISSDHIVTNKNKFLREQVWEILSCICGHISSSDRKLVYQLFGKECDPTFEPKPVPPSIQVDYIVPRGPISSEELSRIPVVNIVEKLKTDWSSTNLDQDMYNENFLNPINSEGVGNMLEGDIQKRPNEYLKNAELFFSKQNLSEQYTYSFLQGVYKIVELNIETINDDNFINLLSLFKSISKSWTKEDVSNKPSINTLDNNDDFNWQYVHYMIAKILDIFLMNFNDAFLNLKIFREDIIDLLRHLLEYPNPSEEDELLVSTKFEEYPSERNTYLVSNPSVLAINSVRGCALDVITKLILREYKPNQASQASAQSTIPSDIKEILSHAIANEKTRAIFFQFGRYLPFFFFHDQQWLLKILSKVFPTFTNKKHLALAAWEGYLYNSVYEEIFFNTLFQDLYLKGLDYSSDDDPGREFLIDPREGIANHIAIAFIYFFDKFDFESELFTLFWHNDKGNKIVFVDFIGRRIISRGDGGIKQFIQENPGCKKRFMELWDFILENEDAIDLFKVMGSWINLSTDIFDLSWLIIRTRNTLSKSGGILNWGFGLEQAIKVFAQINPEETIKILRLYLLEGKIRSVKPGYSFFDINQFYEVFDILYSNPITRIETQNLISKLIEEGGSSCWELKKILGN